MGISRQRMLDALAFSRPDRIPVVYHSSPAGLHKHGEPLRQLLLRHPPDNPVCFDRLPHPPPGCVDAAGCYRELRVDPWGVTWEHRIFGLHGHVAKHPLADLAQAEAYIFPAVPSLESDVFLGYRRSVQEQQRAYFVSGGNVSLFERLCALRPMDEVLMDLATGEPALLALLDRLVAHWQQEIAYHVAAGVDGVWFGDDWGTQTATLVSPALFREIFMPRYRVLMDQVQAGGARVLLHSCGYLGGIFPAFVELGIDAIWPQIGLFEAHGLDRVCAERGIALYIHPDRQHLVPHGTPEQIAREIQRYARRYAGGGGVFYVEVENDAPLANARALIEAVAMYR